MTSSDNSTKWLKKQRINPKCIAIDYHFSDPLNTRWEFVFKDEGYVLKQFCWCNSRLTIEDHWNGDVLAFTDEMYDNDQVRCAEVMLQNARGNENVGKEIVEQIIYKLMIGDIKLMELNGDI